MSATHPDTLPDEAPYPDRSRAWQAVALLTLATVFAYIDRLLLYILAEPVLQTLDMSDTQLSILQGLAFIAFYAVFGVPLGRMADRHNRRNLVVAGVALWSLMTILCGLADDFWTLFFARAGVGVGEACLLPAAFSMIADYFPQRLRGRAMSCIVLAMPIGSGGSFLLGGAMAGIVPGTDQIVLPVIGSTYGWQLSFFVAGLPGFLIAALLLGIMEPPRRDQAPSADPASQHRSTTPGLWAFVRTHHRLLTAFIVGACTLALTTYAVTSWMATYYIRHFGYPVATVGLYIGLLNIAAGVCGAAAGGYMSDLSARNPHSAGRLRVIYWSAFAMAPCLFLWIYVDALLLSALFLFAIQFGFAFSVAGFPSALQAVVPNQFRGTVLAVLYAGNGVVGAGLGPLVIALGTDYLFPGSGLRASLLAIPPLTMLLAACIIVWRRSDYRAARLDRNL